MSRPKSLSSPTLNCPAPARRSPRIRNPLSSQPGVQHLAIRTVVVFRVAAVQREQHAALTEAFADRGFTALLRHAGAERQRSAKLRP